MKCIYCGCMDSKVIDSRVNEDGTSIRRRRECMNCGKRFTTYDRAHHGHQKVGLPTDFFTSKTQKRHRKGVRQASCLHAAD